MLPRRGAAFACLHAALVLDGGAPPLAPGRWAACRQAGFRDVELSPELQNLLASPLLPRGWWNQQLLLALKQVGGAGPWLCWAAGVSACPTAPDGIPSQHAGPRSACSPGAAVGQRAADLSPAGHHQRPAAAGGPQIHAHIPRWGLGGSGKGACRQRQPFRIAWLPLFIQPAPLPAAADEDMLIGRAQGNGGVFVFTRDAEAQEAAH